MAKQPKHDTKNGTFTRQLDYDKIAYLRYEEKLSLSEISHKMSCSSTAIAYALKKMNENEDETNNTRK